MSPMAAWRVSLIGAALTGSAVAYVSDETWNYANHGTDWDFEPCNDTSTVQSPISISDTPSPPIDWALGYSFLTAWSVPESITDHGFTNWVYTIKATDGNLGLFYAAETFVGP